MSEEEMSTERLIVHWVGVLTVLLMIGLLLWGLAVRVTAEHTQEAHDRAAACQKAAPEQVTLCLKVGR